MTDGGLGGGVPHRPTEERGNPEVWSNGRFVSVAEWQKSSRFINNSTAQGLPTLGSTAAQVGVFAPYVPSIQPTDGILIPGIGQDCGLENGVYARKIKCCKNDGHPHFEWHGISCGQSGCPRHWVQWAHRAADRIGCRIEGFYHVKRNKRYFPRHIVLSIAEDDPILAKLMKMMPIKRIEYLRKYFIKLAKKYGCDGGSLVVHDKRTNDEVPDSKGSKKWDWVRNQGSSWVDYTKFSPHAHIIGYGYMKKWEKGEFLYANLGKLETRDDVEAAAFYQVSHAAIVDGMGVVVYFGTCSYRNLKRVTKWNAVSALLCRECGACMVYEDSGEIIETRRSMGDYMVVEPGRGPPDKATGISEKERAVWGPSGKPVREGVLS